MACAYATGSRGKFGVGREFVWGCAQAVSSKHALGLAPVPLALSVALEGVLHLNGAVAQELLVHAFDGQVGRLEAIKRYEPKAFCDARVDVAHHFWRFGKRSKR